MTASTPQCQKCLAPVLGRMDEHECDPQQLTLIDAMRPTREQFDAIYGDLIGRALSCSLQIREE